ncbi:MAG TPA: helix-turn-helix domain-containing protein [Chloroflexota bacterium]|nr:helix-turn-helix domain-containing protein [Chloroflexota bacterium]
MPRFHVVTLDEAQRLLLEKTVRSGTASARTVTRARILLKSDTDEFGPGWIETKIADALDISQSTVERTRKRAAWEEKRDRTATTVDWRFTTQDARIKLKRLYPIRALGRDTAEHRCRTTVEGGEHHRT